jgi:glucokinase
MRPAAILALDFGGTKHSAALLDWPVPANQPPAWRSLVRVKAAPGADRQADLEIMLSSARSLLAGARPQGIGVSFGGPVDHQRGIVLLSHHVPGWESFPLADYLQAEFNTPARIDNDANLAALGEFRFGAGDGAGSLLYLTVSTGVGGGWVLDGKIWHGADSLAGEIGHTIVDPGGPLCLCGKRGCVERLASGPYMAQDARETLQLNPDHPSLLRSLVHDDLAALTGLTISQAAFLGDELAISLLTRSARALGAGISNACNLLNPERVILGGGVTGAGDLFWQELRRTARQLTLPQISLNILPVALGDDSPLWGAVALAGEII